MGKQLSIVTKSIILILLIYLASAMIISPTTTMQGASDAISLCASTVIPSLFPFIFCANLFVELGAARLISQYLSRLMLPLFNVSGSGALAFVLGIVSGYPVGAVCASSLYQSGECSKTEAERLLAFCNNSGPMFIIGAVGTNMLGNSRLGIFLYLIHISSSIICGMLFKMWGKKSVTKLLPPAKYSSSIKNAVPDIGTAISKSVDTIFVICGFVLIFAVFTSVLPNNSIKQYIYCLLEITGGIKELAKSNTSLTLPLISFFLALSGVSVFSQVYAIITPCGLSPASYILGKALQGVIAFTITYISVGLSPVAVPTFSPVTSSIVSAKSLVADSLTITALSISVLFALAFICKLFKRHTK